MAKYKIWNRKDTIITPSGEVFTPEQWVAKHPICGIESIKSVISGGVINGALLMEFTSMVERATKAGCDFTNCETDQDYLDAIEAFEEARNVAASESVSTDERIAAALEAQVMMSMTDVEDESVTE